MLREISPRLLRRADAPGDLISWIDSLDHGEAGAWEQCDRGDWLIWLAALEGVPVIALIDAAAACARRAAKAMDSQRKPLNRAIKAARERVSPDACAEAAQKCELLAKSDGADTYRSTTASSYQHAASSAAHVARAAEGLLLADTQVTAQRLQEGELRAAGIGLGMGATVSGPAPLPAQLELGGSPSAEWIHMAVDAAAQSVLDAVRALAPDASDETEHERVEGELSELVFGKLDPVREGLRNGVHPTDLVPMLPSHDPEAKRPKRDAAEEIPKPKSTVRSIGITVGLVMILSYVLSMLL